MNLTILIDIIMLITAIHGIIVSPSISSKILFGIFGLLILLMTKSDYNENKNQRSKKNRK